MKIAFLHTEGRMQYVYEMMNKDYDVGLFDENYFDYDVIVLGMRYFDANVFTNEYLEKMNNKVIIFCYDASIEMKERFHVVCLKSNEKFLVDNAQVTAWGILAVLLNHCRECLSDYEIDIIGYGRCGQAIVRLFDALGVKSRIIVNEIRNYNREVIHFEEYLFKKPAIWIIQTADVCIFDYGWVRRFGKDCTIIDITSQFIGTNALKDKDILIYYAKALPDKYCVFSAAKIYYEAIKEVLVCEF